MKPNNSQHSVRRLVSAIGIGCCLLISTHSWATGMSGTTVGGNLVLPWYTAGGNYFSPLDSRGNPTTTLPVYSVVGSGIEFTYAPPLYGSTTAVYLVTADISDTQITIHETYGDSNPDISMQEATSWTLTLTGLALGGAGIGQVDYVSRNSNISVASFDAHSVQFTLNSIELPGPGGIFWTTVVRLTPVPEPTGAGMLLTCAAAFLWRQRR